MSEPNTKSNEDAGAGRLAESTDHNGPGEQAKTNGQARSDGRPRSAGSKAGRHDLDALIQQAEALRTSLRETLLKNNELLKGLKRHRRVSRSLQTTLASLRQLKTLGV